MTQWALLILFLLTSITGIFFMKQFTHRRMQDFSQKIDSKTLRFNGCLNLKEAIISLRFKTILKSILLLLQIK